MRFGLAVALLALAAWANTRNAKVKATGDFTDSDKIAVPAIKALLQAVVLDVMEGFASFTHAVGAVKNEPASWRDSFFPEARGLRGS